MTEARETNGTFDMRNSQEGRVAALNLVIASRGMAIIGAGVRGSSTGSMEANRCVCIGRFPTQCLDEAATRLHDGSPQESLVPACGAPACARWSWSLASQARLLRCAWRPLRPRLSELRLLSG